MIFLGSCVEHSLLVVLWCRYWQILLHDNTYRCNRFGLPMGLFASVDEFGRCVLLAQSLVDQEGTNDYEWAFTCFFAAVGKYPRVLFSDADLAVEAALPTCIPEGVHHLWCFFHILTNVRKNVGPLVGAEVDDVLRDLRQVHRATDVRIAEALWERLLHKWGQESEMATYLQRLGGDKMKKWVIAYHVDVFTASMTTTGRSESLNRVCKMFLSKRSTLVKVMEELLARASHEATVRLQSTVKCNSSRSDCGRSSRVTFPTVYDLANEYLTPYGMSLFTKQALRCTVYNVEPITYEAVAAPLNDDTFSAALRLASEENPDFDVVDPPSFVAASRFAEERTLQDGNSAVFSVKADAATETRGAPQTLILYAPDQASGIFTRFYCSCGYSVRAGVPCRHFLAAVRSPSSKAGFHLDLFNHLWFKKQFTHGSVVHYHRDAPPVQVSITSPPVQALVPGDVPLQAEGYGPEELIRLSEARSIGILLGESKDAVQAAMDHGKFDEFREYLRSWIKEHPIQSTGTSIQNPIKKAARGRKRQTAAQLAATAKRRRDRAKANAEASSAGLGDPGDVPLTQAYPAAAAAPPPPASVAGAARKCGHCGMEGHNRRTCPHVSAEQGNGAVPV